MINQSFKTIPSNGMVFFNCTKQIREMFIVYHRRRILVILLLAAVIWRQCKLETD